MDTTDPVAGATPPFLPEPRRSGGERAFRAAQVRLVATEKLFFQRAVVPYLRILFSDSLFEVQDHGAFDTAGIDQLTFSTAGELDTVVQFKGFSVTPAEVGAGQAGQCLDSIASFRKKKRHSAGYLLLHNRDHRNPLFVDPVESALRALRTDGLVEWVALWSVQNLLHHVVGQLESLVTKQWAAESEQSMRDACALLTTGTLENVPFTETRYMVRRGSVDPIGTPVEHVGDPVGSLKDSDRGVTVLLGGFGFGKTTAAVRTVSTWSRNALFVPAAKVGSGGHSNSKELLLDTLTSEILASLPTGDCSELADLVTVAARRTLLSPDHDFVLVLDGLDESPVLGGRDGLRFLLHSFKKYQTPVILTLRSELWNSRITELSLGLSDDEKASTGRSIRVLEMGTWTSREILDYLDLLDGVDDDREARNLSEFKHLVESGAYERYYGDIPRRPLFLHMILDDVRSSGPRERSRVELFDDWINEKLLRDYTGPLDVGGEGRVAPLAGAAPEIDQQLRDMRAIMTIAASHMVKADAAAQISLLPYISEQQLRACLPGHLASYTITGLVTNSLLVPERTAGRSRPLRLKFAHRAFQEFFLASAQLSGRATVEGVYPSTVDQWITDMRRQDYDFVSGEL